MGILERLHLVAAAKANTIMNKLEDPNESMDLALEKQYESLKDIQAGIAEVVTVKKRLELRKGELQSKSDKQQQIAVDAVAASNDNLARAALSNKEEMDATIRDIDSQITEIATQQQKLQNARDALQNRIEDFRTKKEKMKAEYTAAKAEVKIKESLTGLTNDMNSMRSSVERATEKTEQMKARASAMDELIDTGALPTFGSETDVVEKELRAQTVDAKLAELKSKKGKKKTE